MGEAEAPTGVNATTGGEMQKHKTGAWELLLIVLGLDGVASWAMLWQHDLPLSLCCVLVGLGLLLESVRRWRRGP